jgi:hypothetical protein
MVDMPAPMRISGVMPSGALSAEAEMTDANEATFRARASNSSRDWSISCFAAEGGPSDAAGNSAISAGMCSYRFCRTFEGQGIIGKLAFKHSGDCLTRIGHGLHGLLTPFDHVR